MLELSTLDLPERPPMTIAVMPLLDTLRARAGDRALLEQLGDHPTDRSWMRLHSSDDLELWLIAWPPGSATDWHDHGAAAGACAVLRGSLVEHQWRGGLQLNPLRAGDARTFDAGHIHDVRNDGATPALSLHAYSPRLEIMTRYRFRGDRVEVLGVEKAGGGVVRFRQGQPPPRQPRWLATRSRTAGTTSS